MPLWLKEPRVPYHQQDTDRYCGAAVAQMLLEALDHDIFDQQQLYDGDHPRDPHDPCPGSNWFTAPQTLADTLNRRHRVPGQTFIARYFTDAASGLQTLADALLTTRVAPAAVVFGRGHWVVVTGLQAETAPEAAAPLAIRGLYINDPLPPTPDGRTLPPPHSRHDRCGTGGSGGIGDQYVTCAEWLDTYFDGWQCQGGEQVYYAAVYDRASVTAGIVRVAPPGPPAAARTGAPPPPDRTHWISEADALVAAQAGIAAHELARQGPLAPVLRDALPAAAWPVRYVGRDAGYYLVLLYANGMPVATARVDARDGTFLGAVGVAAAIVPASAVLDRVRHVVPEAKPVDDTPELVWQHSLQFPSPYYPFYVVAAGTEAVGPVYAGADGRFHRELTELHA